MTRGCRERHCKSLCFGPDSQLCGSMCHCPSIMLRQMKKIHSFWSLLFISLSFAHLEHNATESMTWQGFTASNTTPNANLSYKACGADWRVLAPYHSHNTQRMADSFGTKLCWDPFMWPQCSCLWRHTRWQIHTDQTCYEENLRVAGRGWRSTWHDCVTILFTGAHGTMSRNYISHHLNSFNLADNF